MPPVKLMQGGEMNRDVLAMLLNNVRTPQEREGDLGAQLAARHTGADRLREVCARYGAERAEGVAAELLNYSEDLMSAFVESVPAGDYRVEDFLDGDGISERPVKIAVAIRFRRALKKHRRDKTTGSGRLRYGVTVDFAGSDSQVEGSINAVFAITYSACFYVFRCLLAEDVPATAGLMRPIQVVAPEGSVVNARPPAAVAGGERGDLPTNRGRLAAGPFGSNSGTGSSSGFGNDEQSDDRRNRSAHRRTVYVLRNDCGRYGRETGEARGFRCAHTHDEFAKHAGRGVGACVSATSALIFAAQRQRRPRTVLWRRRNRAGNRSAHRLRRDPVGRSPDSGTVGSSGRIGGRYGRGIYQAQGRFDREWRSSARPGKKQMKYKRRRGWGERRERNHSDAQVKCKPRNHVPFGADQLSKRELYDQL